MKNSKYFKTTFDLANFDKQKAITDLSEIIKCKSVSDRDQSKMDFNEFKKIHEYIFASFPNIMKYSTHKIINEGSIYFVIKGKNESLPYGLFMGHLDVVPPIKEEQWEFDPFSGLITDEYICGRGAMDMKHIDAAVLNAIEYSLKTNGQPTRGIYICFGHDEETLGGKGQWAIKEDLKANKASLAFVLDEGGGFVDGTPYSASKLLAINDVMEKGFMNVIIEGTAKGGHSSHPGNNTALGNVANAIYQITSHPFAPKMNEPLKKFFKSISPYMENKDLVSLINNMDNDEEALLNFLVNSEFAPFVQTTIAPTQIESNSKGANVLPSYVKSLINLRLGSGDTVEDVKKHILEVTKGIDVTITFEDELDASKISSLDSNEYNLLKELSEKYFDCIYVPFLSIGGTDCCFYNEMCPNCFRFAPMCCDFELHDGVHGMNEKINIEAYLYSIMFYVEYINKTCY